MFSFFRKNVIGRRQFSIRVVETPFLLRSSSAISSTDHTNSFTVSYLINSCGLSQEKALSVSKKVHFETSTKPDSVLTLLRNNGFTNTHISKLIKKHPMLLLANAHKTLKPKFDFFNSVGLSATDLAKVLSVDPFVLRSNLEKTIIPSFDFLKSIVHTESNVVAMLKCSTWVLRKWYQKILTANAALLRACGVPDSNIKTLLVTQPISFLRSTSRFNEIVEEVKKMGFDPSQYMFLIAIQGFTSMRKSTLEAKFDVYRRWGWSTVEIQCAFRKEPHCMMLSEKKIMRSMDFLVNKMGYDRLLIANAPSVLKYSVEKRIIPRCSVMQVLISNDMVENHNLVSLLTMPEKDFLKKYVTKFEEKAPELLIAYQGKGRWIV